MNYKEYLKEREQALQSGILVTEPISQLPENLDLTGKFQTSETTVKNKTVFEPIIEKINYNVTRDNKLVPACFFVVKTNLTDKDNGKEYENRNVGLTDEIKEIVADSSKLQAEYDFKTVKGRNRTFVVMVQ